MLDGFLTLYRGYVIRNENENKQTPKGSKIFLDIVLNVRTHNSVIIDKKER